MKRLLVIIAALAIVAAAIAIASDSTQTTKESTKMEKPKEEAAVDTTGAEKVKWTENESGLRWMDLTVGKGAEAKNGDKVEVHYHLWLAKGEEKGNSVQNSRDFGKTFPFTVGQPGLIKGWNEGMLGMKPGTLRRLLIPSKLGYGAQAQGNDIPANSDLLFEIELITYPGK
ncbi:MAG: FKBP-type peptidyl-prolyl cis-trans isomerase [candidate division Zixibacteria bacterium]